MARLPRTLSLRCFEYRDAAIQLPELDVIGLDKLQGSFPRLLLVGTMKIRRANHVATLVKKVSSVMRHPQRPPPGQTSSTSADTPWKSVDDL